jgi:lipoprotein NlpD
VLKTDEYRVQRGDTLFGIAWQSGVDYRLLAAWNGIRPPYRIYPGQTLRLSPPAAARTPPPSPQPIAKAKPRPATPPSGQRPAASSPAKATTSTPTPPGPRHLVWGWPAQGEITARFKSNDPLRKGIKITGRSGDPIRSAEAGRVVYSGSGLIGYGRLIIVKHNDNYLSAYGHNKEILVREGDQVTKGQKIAAMGTANTGEPLLHFEIRRDGKPVDPLRLLPRR